eukprot:CAMPEP_0175209286 /NCGR_PEP_ID=MMETSP0093-20121207/14054_1 /TAXON_ID=311494 /ORGANISM="Alexandrium monilatum, Strain CCMP3105" /LENGTH=125 /DNA_ID=CAMNT_0016502485 /DNA_START=85 /DNA_END=462 /DNA_ORIENTATION=-
MAVPMKAATAMKAVMKKSGAKGSMKAMKAMKAMKSKVATGRLAKSMVYKGSKAKTSGGLKASDIMRNKRGKFVSKRKSAAGLNFPWPKAVAAARAALGIKGFVCINSGPEGKAIYDKAKAILAAS